MHDLPSVTLLQQAHANSKSGEELEVLGKQAARKYSSGDSANLNDAVIETVKHAGLSPEQVKRVIEFANVGAYLSEFNKEGSTHKYIEFNGGPASPVEILKELNAGGGGTVFDRGLSDYALEPPQVKQASVLDKNLSVVHDALDNFEVLEKAASAQHPSMLDIAYDMGQTAKSQYGSKQHGGAMDPFGQTQAMHRVHDLQAMTGRAPVVVKQAEALDFDPVDSALKQAFQVEEQLIPYADPWQDCTELREKIAGAVEHITSEMSGLEIVFEDSLNELYHQVKEAALEGNSLGQVMGLWQHIVPDAEYVKTAFAHIGPRLVQEGVFESLDAMGSSLTKTAAMGMPNMEHPLISTMAVYCESLTKLAELKATRDELIQERERLGSFLRKAAGVAGAAKKGLEALEGAGKFVGGGLAGLGHPTAGKVVGKSIQYAPHAIGALAGAALLQDIHDHMKYGPYGSRVTQAIASRVPGTPSNQQRKQQIAYGGY